MPEFTATRNYTAAPQVNGSTEQVTFVEGETYEVDTEVADAVNRDVGGTLVEPKPAAKKPAAKAKAAAKDDGEGDGG